MTSPAKIVLQATVDMAIESKIQHDLDLSRWLNANRSATSGSITGMTQANPVVVTSASHGRSNNEEVIIDDVIGQDEVNGRRFTVAIVATNTFELSGENGTNHDTYSSGGKWYLAQTIDSSGHDCTHIPPLDADGNDTGTALTTSGGITIGTPANLILPILIGPFNSDNAITGTALASGAGEVGPHLFDVDVRLSDPTEILHVRLKINVVYSEGTR